MKRPCDKERGETQSVWCYGLLAGILLILSPLGFYLPVSHQEGLAWGGDLYSFPVPGVESSSAKGDNISEHGFFSRLSSRFSETEFQNLHTGPLLIQGQSFFHVLRMNSVPWLSIPLEKGQFELQTYATWVNLWGWKAGKYHVDGEQIRFSVALNYGLSERLELRVEVPAMVRMGGCMDGLVEGFHGALNLFNANKELFPRNRYRVVFYPPEGGEHRLDAGATGLSMSDLVFSVKMRLFSGNRYLPAVFLGGNMKVPTGSIEGGGVDVGGSISLAKRVWRLHGYFCFDYWYCSQERILGIRMNPGQWRLFMGLEYPFAKRFSILLQQLINCGAASDLYQFSSSTHEVALGMRWRFLSRTMVELGIIENTANYDNSPDLGFHLGLRHRFN